MSTEQEWHYTDATGQQIGPVSANQLQELSTGGHVTAATQVWTEGMDAWAPASQVEGLLPPAPVAEHPDHQPQINLGAGSGIHLESSIQPCPMGQSLTTNYSQKTKGPGKAIFITLLAIAAIGTGVYFAILPPSEETTTETPGLSAYTEANDQVSASDDGSILGNSGDSLSIGKRFLSAMSQSPKAEEPEQPEEPSNRSEKQNTIASLTTDPVKEEAQGQETPPDQSTSTKEKLKLALHCHTNTIDNKKSVTLLVKLPTLHELSDEDKEALVNKAWINSKLALANTPYSDANTTLILALRGITTYDTILIGQPLITQSADKAPLEGVSKTHQGKESEEKLYPYFIRQK